MKDIIDQMDKAFDSRVRIAIMSLLLVHEWMDFNALKERLGVTDGNLASHTASLENKQFIVVQKKFVGKRPNTSYKATEHGRIAFGEYILALKKLLEVKG
ncbi:MAG: transcriptional regulator [Chitinophagales bacterium]